MRNKIAKSISLRSDRRQYARTGSTAYAPLQEPKLKTSKRQQRLAKNKDRFERGIALLKVFARTSSRKKGNDIYWLNRLDSWLRIRYHENKKTAI